MNDVLPCTAGWRGGGGVIGRDHGVMGKTTLCKLPMEKEGYLYTVSYWPLSINP
jgi:hypothetical protein